MAKGIQFVIGRPKGKTTTEVETVLFDAKQWTLETARAWLRANGYRKTTAEPRGPRSKELRFRQRSITSFQPGSLRTIAAGRRRNPDAELKQGADLYEQFHGKPAARIDEVELESRERKTYTKLGDLVELDIHRGSKLIFDKDRPVLASDPRGHQLYVLGDVVMSKESLSGYAADKDLIDLGEASFIVYFTRKGFDNFEPVEYKHKFGEETGERPHLLYDRRNRRLLFAGGAYQVKPEGIVN